MKQDMIVIIDLGSTKNAKLARDIRALGVYSEIHNFDITETELNAKGYATLAELSEALGDVNAVLDEIIGEETV